jgi:ribonuclease-3
MPNDLKKLEKIIGHQFQDTDTLTRALTHKSYAAEIGTTEFNERMEFLGDSILSAVVADYLYHRHPDQDEGKLSQLKSQIVSGHNLSKWAKELKLGSFIFISKGEESNGGRTRESLLSNTLEALIAALYLDAGFAVAREFILGHLVLLKRVVITDTKSKLQEYVQSAYQTLPYYRVLSETGPDHEKLFEIGVYLRKELLGSGTGRSKKDAQQLAAKKALKFLREKKLPSTAKTEA